MCVINETPNYKSLELWNHNWLLISEISHWRKSLEEEGGRWDYSLWLPNSKVSSESALIPGSWRRGCQWLPFILSFYRSVGWAPTSLSSQASPEWQILRLRQSSWAQPWHSQPAAHARFLPPGRPVLPAWEKPLKWEGYSDGAETSHAPGDTSALTKSKGFPFWQGIQNCGGGTGSVALGHSYWQPLRSALA